MENIESKLKEFLGDGKDWERKQTNIPGVFLLRLPAFRSRPECVAIEIDATSRVGGGGGKGNRQVSTDGFWDRGDSRAMALTDQCIASLQPDPAFDR